MCLRILTGLWICLLATPSAHFQEHDPAKRLAHHRDNRISTVESPLDQHSAGKLHLAWLQDKVPKLIPERHDYVAPMKRIAAGFKGREGVVLHVGDSITYANPYGQWARFGQGKTGADKAILKWMHTNANDKTDGWYLARVDRPGGRSDTAASGIRVDQMLKGGRRGMPSLAELLKKHKPQMVVLMLGTNDASANRRTNAYLADMTKAVDLILTNNSICILSTLPPHPRRLKLARDYNQGLRALAKRRGVPLIDFEREILKRRPKDWNGTLLGKNDVHPTAQYKDTKPSSAPNPNNLRNSGYLLRGWLSVQKIVEVKNRVVSPRKKRALAPTHTVLLQAGDCVRVRPSRPLRAGALSQRTSALW